MGLPGASVSGPPVRVLSVLCAGGVAGTQGIASGKRTQACPCPASSRGDGSREALLSSAQPSLGEKTTLFGGST